MNTTFIVVIILLISFSIAIPWMARSIIWNKAMKALKNNDIAKAKEIFTGRPFLFIFGKFNSEWNCLRLGLSQGDKKEIEFRTKLILEGEFSTKQKVTAARAAYFYYLDREDQEMCKELLTIIRMSHDRKEVLQSEMLYRVLIEKKSEDVDSVKSQLEELSGKKEQDPAQIGLLQYLLGLQYMYAKQEELGKTYLKKAKTHLKKTPYEKKIKKIIG